MGRTYRTADINLLDNIVFRFPYEQASSTMKLVQDRYNKAEDALKTYTKPQFKYWKGVDDELAKELEDYLLSRAKETAAALHANPNDPAALNELAKLRDEYAQMQQNPESLLYKLEANYNAYQKFLAEKQKQPADRQSMYDRWVDIYKQSITSGRGAESGIFTYKFGPNIDPIQGFFNSQYYKQLPNHIQEKIKNVQTYKDFVTVTKEQISQKDQELLWDAFKLYAENDPKAREEFTIRQTLGEGVYYDNAGKFVYSPYTESIKNTIQQYADRGSKETLDIRTRRSVVKNVINYGNGGAGTPKGMEPVAEMQEKLDFYFKTPEGKKAFEAFKGDVTRAIMKPFGDQINSNIALRAYLNKWADAIAKDRNKLNDFYADLRQQLLKRGFNETRVNQLIQLIDKSVIPAFEKFNYQAMTGAIYYTDNMSSGLFKALNKYVDDEKEAKKLATAKGYRVIVDENGRTVAEPKKDRLWYPGMKINGKTVKDFKIVDVDPLQAAGHYDPETGKPTNVVVLTVQYDLENNVNTYSRYRSGNTSDTTVSSDKIYAKVFIPEDELKLVAGYLPK